MAAAKAARTKKRAKKKKIKIANEKAKKNLNGRMINVLVKNITYI